MIGSILVIRLGAVGDVVRTLPAVSALRAGYPDAEITWLVEPGASTVLRGQPWIDGVLVFPRAELAQLLRGGRLLSFLRQVLAFRRQLRASSFDCVLDFHAILKSGLLSFATAAPLRVAYARPFGREGAWLFATHRARVRLPKKGAKLSRFLRNLALVRFLAVHEAPNPTPLRLLPEAAERLVKKLSSEERFVAIHPGTSDATPYKRYRSEGYAEIARSLWEQRGLRCIVTVGPAQDDRAFAERIVAEAKGAAELAPSTPTLADLAALFARCRLYIGSDTGPMHVASLVGTPVIQLLGPTDPVENAPFQGTPSRTIRVPQPCSPCRRGCEEATCMKAIAPEVVVRAACELLQDEQVNPFP